MVSINFDLIGFVLLVVCVGLVTAGTYYMTKWSVQPTSQQYSIYQNMVYVGSFIIFVILLRFFFLFRNLECSVYSH